MALHDIEVPANAIDVVFNEDASLIAVLHQEGISLFEWESTSAGSSEPILTGRITFEKLASAPGNYQQLTFGIKNQIVALQRGIDGETVKYFDFNDDTGRLEELESQIVSVSKIAAISKFFQNGSNHPFVQGRGGDLHSLVFGDNSLSDANAHAYLPLLEILAHNEHHIAFGMTPNGHLYANSRLLVKNCTSFVVTPAHLVFTTTTHLLKFIHITDVTGK